VESQSIELGRMPLRLVQAVVLAFFALKLAHLGFAGPFQDEAYYWMWGQHPALSYFDHPPLNAWLLGLSSRLFGWSVFALRLPVALALVADVAAIALLSRQLAGPHWHSHFWITLLLFVATPFYWMVTALALPDHLLLTFTLFSLYSFIRFFGDEETGAPGSSRDLYLGALSLGLAGLSKYNAAFLGLAVIAFVLLFRRRLLRDVRLYLAGALTLLLQLPVIIWNATEGFASWMFILHGRHAGLKASFDGLIPFVLSIVIFLSPILLWVIGRFLFVRRDPPAAIGLARTAFTISSVVILLVSMTTLVLFHWNLVAYAAVLPYLAIYLKPRWLLPVQAIYGAVFAVAAFVNYAVTPLTPVSAWHDEATAWSYGWAPTVAAVEAARTANAVGFVAAADYTTASLLGFHMHDRDVVSLSTRTDEYDFWFDPAAHKGQDAILFGDTWRPLTPAVAALFESVTELQALPVVVGTTEVDVHHIYLARGFQPDG
jgi:4-amino-4-deoxy-L-arabinose transferase-like glycosyltransferase